MHPDQYSEQVDLILEKADQDISQHQGIKIQADFKLEK